VAYGVNPHEHSGFRVWANWGALSPTAAEDALCCALGAPARPLAEAFCSALGQAPAARRIIIETRQLAAACAWLADQKKGEDIRVFDVSDQVNFADYFVVVTGTSRPHVRAMYDEIHFRLKLAGRTHARAEGVELGWWVLLDFGDVVVHVLQPEAREFYALDDLYGDCGLLDWTAEELPELPAERV